MSHHYSSANSVIGKSLDPLSLISVILSKPKNLFDQITSAIFGKRYFLYILQHRSSANARIKNHLSDFDKKIKLCMNLKNLFDLRPSRFITSVDIFEQNGLGFTQLEFATFSATHQLTSEWEPCR